MRRTLRLVAFVVCFGPRRLCPARLPFTVLAGPLYPLHRYALLPAWLFLDTVSHHYYYRDHCTSMKNTAYG